MVAALGMAPALASMGGCEPPICSMFGEQIQAEGCGESSRLNSKPEVLEFSVPHAMLPGRQQLFRVAVRDPEDDDVLIEWDLDGRPGYELSGRPTGYGSDDVVFAERHWSYRDLGARTVRVRISDYPGLPGGEGVVELERRVRVVTQEDFDANRGPVARLTVSEPILAGTAVQLDASTSSDPDGDRLTYQFWAEGANTEPHDFESRSPKLDVTFPREDNYTIGVRVYDEFGDHSFVQKYVWAYDARRKPHADIQATPNPVRPGRTVTFDASRSRWGGTGGGVTFEWDLDGDLTYELQTGARDWAMRSYDTPGHRTARVRITNNVGFTDVATVHVHVGDGPVAALRTDPATPCVGDAVAFIADGSADPDNDIVRYQWDLDDAAGFERDSTEPRAEHTYHAAGKHFVSVRVTDATENADTAMLELQVEECEEAPPSAELQIEPNPGTVGDPVHFSATQQTGNVIRYEWDLDGTQGYEQSTTTPETTHTYSASGEYFVRLRVVDAAGRDHVDMATLPVAPRLRTFGRAGDLPHWLAPRAALRPTRRVPPRPFSAELRDTTASGPATRLLGGAGRARLRFGGPRRLTAAERTMRRFLRARWRTALKFATNGAGRATVEGVVLAKPEARGRGSRACARVALDLRAGRLPRGKLTILGGTGTAARLRGTASFRFRVDPSGRVTIVGGLRAGLGRPRALPRSCAALSQD